MKTKILFDARFNTFFCFYHNNGKACEVTAHVNAASLADRKAAKARALRDIKRQQRALEEALELTPPVGYVFSALREGQGKVAGGFRIPKRNSAAEKKTDATLGRADWLNYRLKTGHEAVFERK